MKSYILKRPHIDYKIILKSRSQPYKHRDREERRLKALQNKQLSHEGKQQSADYNPKSAPPRLTTADNNTNQALHSKQTKSASTKLELDKYDKSKMAPPVNNPPTEDDIAYQSTLLHMRVVGREPFLLCL